MSLVARFFASHLNLPDTDHPFHRHVIEHQTKIVDYLTDLLKPYKIDKGDAAEKLLDVIDGAFSMRLVFGTSKKIPLLSSAETILRAFRSHDHNVAVVRPKLQNAALSWGHPPAVASGCDRYPRSQKRDLGHFGR